METNVTISRLVACVRARFALRRSPPAPTCRATRPRSSRMIRALARQEWRSDLQDRDGRNGRLVHLFRIPPLSFRVPCLPWARRRGLDLCAGAREFAEDDELRRIRRHRRQRQAGPRAGQENVMPAFADNKNVMCYLNDIYVYLRARSQDAIPRGRPAKHATSRPSSTEAETKCMGE